MPYALPLALVIVSLSFPWASSQISSADPRRIFLANAIYPVHAFLMTRRRNRYLGFDFLGDRPG